MLKMLFDDKPNSNYQVLYFGAHSNDIEIGCGGTLLKLINSYSNLAVY
jgi:LmbE family N-acetylglucosaminyl deacetylase